VNKLLALIVVGVAVTGCTKAATAAKAPAAPITTAASQAVVTMVPGATVNLSAGAAPTAVVVTPSQPTPTPVATTAAVRVTFGATGTDIAAAAKCVWADRVMSAGR
jgi:nitrous oxide reductase accessory protein NosL